MGDNTHGQSGRRSAADGKRVSLAALRRAEHADQAVSKLAEALIASIDASAVRVNPPAPPAIGVNPAGPIR